jgi:predicted amidohydrolase YtcJ
VLALGALPASASAGGATLYHNARVITMDGRGGPAKALFVRSGRVAAVGDVDDLERRPDAVGAARVDLGGATVVPGLQDGHVDLGAMAEALLGVDLSGAHSFEDVIALVETHAKKLPEGTWITGIGWDEKRWTARALPHHLLLSARVPRHPVFLLRRGGRAALVNQAALERADLAGLVQVSDRTVGGRIQENAEGLPTGILFDGACELVRKHVPPYGDEVLANALLRVQETLLARGWTAVHDMGTRAPTLAALRALQSRGRLALRVACYLDGNGEYSGLDALADAVAGSVPGDTLTVAGVRICIDGDLDVGGAALLEPYHHTKDERGMLLLSEDELSLRLSRLVQQNLQPALEAQGDRANRLAIDLLERVSAVQGGLRTLRPRIETALLVSTRDWERVPALSIATSLQPMATVASLEDWSTLLGTKRVRSLCAWLELGPKIGKTVFGSRAPAFPSDPLAGFAALSGPTIGALGGADGETAPVAPRPEEVLACYTTGAAWACRQENRRGKLKAGYAADFTVFAGDPLVPGSSSAVRLVVVDGEVVWRPR